MSSGRSGKLGLQSWKCGIHNIYGVEYDNMFYYRTARLLDAHNVPCAVCYVATRVALLMIPGKYTCPPSWTREYYGWLMGARNSQHRSTYECVDASPQIIPGGQAAEPGARFSNVEPRCGILPCPPYDPEKELSCVVCTR